MSYFAAHGRVKRTRGSAKLYGCPCGAQANEWALVGIGPWLVDPTPNSRGYGGYAYSDNVWDYEAMCRRCHNELDLTSECRAGHAWTEENTHLHPRTGERSCRRCNADRQRATYYRKKANQ